MIMEDDFVLCEHGLRALHYLIDRAQPVSTQSTPM